MRLYADWSSSGRLSDWFDLGATTGKSPPLSTRERFQRGVVWEPRENSDPQYHFDQIMEGSRARPLTCRESMQSVEFGGLLINGRPRSLRLFRGIPKDIFNSRIKEIFHEIGKAWGVPIEWQNVRCYRACRGDVFECASVLGRGDGFERGATVYVNAEGKITGWLNELALRRLIITVMHLLTVVGGYRLRSQ